jgi:hypothetical protein
VAPLQQQRAQRLLNAWLLLLLLYSCTVLLLLELSAWRGFGG